jgi:hypothetical protein
VISFRSCAERDSFAEFGSIPFLVDFFPVALFVLFDAVLAAVFFLALVFIIAPIHLPENSSPKTKGALGKRAF